MDSCFSPRSRRLSLLALCAGLGCSAGPGEPVAGQDEASGGTETGTGTGDAPSGSDDAASSGPSSSESETQSEASSGPSSESTSGGDTEPGDATGAETGVGSSGTDTDGGSDDPLAFLDDEFDDPATLEEWFLRHEVEQTQPQYTTLDIDETTGSALTIVPTTSGWYGDYVGTLVFKSLTGDFRMETHVIAGNVNDPDTGPTQPFNAAGLMVRDPVHGPNQENWVTHNVGFQDFGLATETKNTVNSWSMLQTVASPHEAKLRICRLGSEFTLARRVDDGPWEVMQTYVRNDMPRSVQVGLIVNGWNSTGGMPDFGESPDIQAMFEYIRFRTVAGADDCVAE